MSSPSEDGSNDEKTTSVVSTLRALGRRLVRGALADPSDADPRMAELADADRRSIQRHSLGSRITHWVQTVLFFVLLWTGLAIWTGNYTLLQTGIWDGYYVAFGLHMWAGILILMTFVLFPFYYVYVDDHRQLARLADVRITRAIAEALLGVREYIPRYHQARRAFDADRDHWMTHHPMQKTFFWWIFIFLGLLALTGFGMYREMATDPSWWIVVLGFLESWMAFELLKQIHLTLAFVSVAMVVFHIYFAALPDNWDVLTAMVTGDIDAYIVHGRRDDGPPENEGDDEFPTPAAEGGRGQDVESTGDHGDD